MKGRWWKAKLLGVLMSALANSGLLADHFALGLPSSLEYLQRLNKRINIADFCSPKQNKFICVNPPPIYDDLPCLQAITLFAAMFSSRLDYYKGNILLLQLSPVRRHFLGGNT
jgi:hypothetical protein